jgi:hypothetical protein
MMGMRRTAQVRMERVIARAKARQARVEQAMLPSLEAVEIAVVAPVPLSPYDVARISKWVRDRIVAWPPTNCFHCKLPIVVGQRWTIVGDGDCSARFHEACHRAWLEEREAAARRALGLATIKQSSTQETIAP